ncbi:non-ribosomal peptide synthetase [Zooshikella ganghwensis]|uniref:Non-ribosomal peptide synthetase n=1 Tax=Zooshikella ganghwensis TaxID=202772 RepID=A0A4P9VMW4_9GAMM|nr:non-ribosomal peptide synthetase [Zooshikella ganghwensis]RDH44713.1 non-ribosomal peptide synthetase [Zooshikella ganghwensis]
MDKYFVQQQFSHVSHQFPDNIAVAEEERSISYQCLEKYSNQLAHKLISHQPESSHQASIGLFLPKGIEYILSNLAILKSGHVFIPLATELPHERLNDILTKAKPAGLITDQAHYEELKNILLLLNLDSIKIHVIQYNTESLLYTGLSSTVTPLSQPLTPLVTSVELPTLTLTPEDSNYILFTSGTTGNPKAIIGCHKSLSHFIHWEIKEFQLTDSVKVANFAPTTFDVSLRDIYVPLLSGGTCCIPSPKTLYNPGRLLEWIINTGITLLHCVPSIFRLLMNELEANKGVTHQLKQLSFILLAGEPLLGRDVNRWYQLIGQRVELVNLYGPSETTLAKLFYRIPGPVEATNKPLPIGLPLPNTAVLILDNEALCRAGEIGEIYIKTPFRSKGYLDDPELTNQSFIQNPLNPDVHDIIYKTGDLGCYQQDWSVEILGRLDRQVKLNGIRVELADIEGHILSLEEIDHCFLTLHSDDNDTQRLVCYYTCRQSITDDELKTLISKKVAPQLLPSLFIQLEQFPLLMNGKVDRKSLPNPLLYLNQQESQTTEPLSTTESTLLKIWTHCLGLSTISTRHRFFELGGTSLTAMKVIAELYRALGVEVSIQAFYQHDSIASLASHIDDIYANGPQHDNNEVSSTQAQQQNTSEPSSFTYTPLPLAPIQAHYPLADQQKSLWVMETLAETEVSYSIPGACQIHGSFDSNRLAQALQALIQQHDSLHMAITSKNKLPQCIIQSDYQLPLEFIDLTAAYKIDKQQTMIDLQQRMYNDSQSRFQLDKAPLFNVKLYKLTSQQHVLYYCFHHIIADAWSIDIFLRSLIQAYHDINTLKPLSYQYQDYCYSQQHHKNSTAYQQHQTYWLQQLKGTIPALNLPTDFSRPPQKQYKGAEYCFSISPSLTQQLKSLCKQQHCSLFTVLMSAYSVFLNKYTAQKDIIIGFPTAGRKHPDLAHLIGMFVNTLPLRINVACDDDILSLIGQIESKIKDALHHQSFPLEAMIDAVQHQSNALTTNDASRHPLFDTLFVLQNTSNTNTASIDNITFEHISLPQTVAWYDLILNCMEVDDSIRCKIIYDTALFKPKTIQRMGKHFVELIAQFVAQTSQPISSLSLLDQTHYQQLNKSLQPQFKSLPFTNIHTSFEQQVIKSPSATALKFFDCSISYHELNQSANKLARYLLENNVKPGDIVATHLPRSPSIIIATLAILKVGAVYLPIDTQSPLSRKTYILNDSGAKFIICAKPSTTEEIKTAIAIKHIMIDSDSFDHYSAENPLLTDKPSDIAYIIYTSGSTGKPKGTQGHHQGIINLAQYFGQYLALTPSDCFLQFANCAFDASLFETFITLLNGCTLSLVSDEVIDDFRTFEAYLNQQHVTVAVLPPTYLRHLIPNNIQSLKTLITAGSATHYSLVEKWWDKVRYINAYGPTEASVCASVFDVSQLPLAALKENYKSIPIGFPIDNVRLDIVDVNLQLLPDGIPGELCISGLSVALGYHCQPELTNKAFMPNPHAPKLMMYKTGDMARRLEDGTIEFLGRKDDQVKVRGYRIELAEIEATIQQLSYIQDAVVVVDTQEQLHGFYLGEDHHATDIRAVLHQQLPSYMVPHTLTAHSVFPLTPNGKIDKEALLKSCLLTKEDSQSLAKPDSQSLSRSTAYDISSKLTDACKHVLNVNKIALDKGFVSQGGDSLKAIQLAALLRKKGIDVKAKQVLHATSLSALCEQVSLQVPSAIAQSVQSSYQPLKSIPLTPIQHWFFHHYQGDQQRFFQTILLHNQQGIHYTSLNRAFQCLVKHHDALRLSFNKQHLQCLSSEELFVNFHHITLVSNDIALMKPHISAITEQDWLSKTPMIQGIVFHTPDQGDYLFLIAHHLIIDTVSWHILVDDLTTAYQTACKEQDFNLPTSSSFQQWAYELAQYQHHESLLAEKKYWQHTEQAIHNAFKLHPNSTGASTTKTLHLNFNQSDTDILLNQSRQLDITVQTLLLTVHARAMALVFGPHHYAFAIEHHGREDLFESIDITRTVGWFTSVYPFIIDQTKQLSLTENARQIQTALGTVPNNGIGYGILKYLNIDPKETEACSTLELDPDLQVIFNYYGNQTNSQNTNTQPFLSVDQSQLSIPSLEQTMHYRIELSAIIIDGKLQLALRYQSKYINDEQASQWLAQVKNELNAYQSNDCKQQSFDKQLAKLKNKFNLPGLVVGIQYPDGKRKLSSLGSCNLKTGQPLSTSHTFHIGSLSKTFIATLVFQLIDQQQIQLEQTLADFFDDHFFEKYAFNKHITIGQLLSHRSGLADYIKNTELLSAIQQNPQKQWSALSLLDFATEINKTVDCQPINSTNLWHHSSTNYILLGLIIEYVTHQPLAQTISSHIFSPLALTQTSLDNNTGTTLAIHQSLATGHDIEGNPVVLKNTSYAGCAGSMISSVDDLLTWQHAFIEGSLLTNESHLQMFDFLPLPDHVTPASDIKAGFGVFNIAGRIGHLGDIQGYEAAMLSQDNTHIIILINGQTQQSAFSFNGSLIQSVCDLI